MNHHIFELARLSLLCFDHTHTELKLFPLLKKLIYSSYTYGLPIESLYIYYVASTFNALFVILTFWR